MTGSAVPRVRADRYHLHRLGGAPMAVPPTGPTDADRRSPVACSAGLAAPVSVRRRVVLGEDPGWSVTLSMALLVIS